MATGEPKQSCTGHPHATVTSNRPVVRAVHACEEGGVRLRLAQRVRELRGLQGASQQPWEELGRAWEGKGAAQGLAHTRKLASRKERRLWGRAYG